MADAQASFRSIVGAGVKRDQIDVLRTAIMMTAGSAGSPGAITAWMKDGSAFRRDFVDTPHLDRVRNNGNLPFSLDKSDIPKLRAVGKPQARSSIASASGAASPSLRRGRACPISTSGSADRRAMISAAKS